MHRYDCLYHCLRYVCRLCYRTISFWTFKCPLLRFAELGAFLIRTKVRGWQVEMDLTGFIGRIFWGDFVSILACTLPTPRPGTKNCLCMPFLPVFWRVFCR